MWEIEDYQKIAREAMDQPDMPREEMIKFGVHPEHIYIMSEVNFEQLMLMTDFDVRRSIAALGASMFYLGFKVREQIENNGGFSGA